MDLIVNGEPYHTGAESLAELLSELSGGQVPAAAVAVAIDGQVVPRSAWHQPLTAGASIDILNAVQGG